MVEIEWGLTISSPLLVPMGVIVELALDANDFELGRILQLEDKADIVLETMVPMGEASIPFLRVRGGRDAFQITVGEHPAVNDITVVNTTNDETLYAFDWQSETDAFFDGLHLHNGHVLEAGGTATQWTFELRFSTHDDLSAFQTYCDDNEVSLQINRIYNPTKPDAGRWFGLTGPQREMLTRAVEAGYYAIPRESSTKGLAEEFGISDQAVTERLRRGIATLVTNTLLVTAESETEQTIASDD